MKTLVGAAAVAALAAVCARAEGGAKPGSHKGIDLLGCAGVVEIVWGPIPGGGPDPGRGGADRLCAGPLSKPGMLECALTLRDVSGGAVSAPSAAGACERGVLARGPKDFTACVRAAHKRWGGSFLEEAELCATSFLSPAVFRCATGLESPDGKPSPEKAAAECEGPKKALLAKMIRSDHELSERERTVLNVFYRYGTEALSRLHDWGFAIQVTDRYDDFPASRYGPASAYYDSSTRAITLRKDYLEGESSTQVRNLVKNAASAVMGEQSWGEPWETAIHEMGHAWDDYVFSGGASNDSQVQELFRRYEKRAKGLLDCALGVGGLGLSAHSAQWSNYATCAVDSPVEYLAEGYRMYGQSAQSRRTLREKDPDFYLWLEPYAAVLYGEK